MRLLFTLMVGIQIGLAQTGSIKGRVISKSDGELLFGVNVLLHGTLRGTTTNVQGEFTLTSVPVGAYSLTFSLVGYQRETVADIAVAEGQTVDVTAELVAVAIKTGPVVVTASKREQSLQEVPVSVSVLDAADIALHNSIAVDEALRYVPGVNITESQVNIRGSSGYSRGAGSRVLMLVDGVPFLTGDTGELNFETIPIGQVDRIEVVKGASSALYGSSALGGVINVLMKPIPEQPETQVRTWGGFYGNPSHQQWDWGGGSRFLNGLSITHSHAFNDLGLVVYGSRIEDDGYRQNDFKHRYNGYVKMRYNLSSFDALTTTFNIFHQRRGSFLYWRSLDSALVPPRVEEGDIVQSTRFFLTGQYNHVVANSFFYNVKGMWFRNRWDDTIDTSTNSSKSDIVRTEFQATWFPNTFQVITFGVEGTINRVNADLFGVRSGGGVAVYAQDEWQLSERIKATMGVRYDFQDLDSLEANSQVNPKLGFVFTPTYGTALRASFGRGFRSPSVAEAFVTTQISGFTIVPNPGLQPERSYSYEIGASQILGETALLDLALFQSDFSNLIEAGFNPAGQGQFSNLTKARIRGLEASVKLGFFNKDLFVDVGYTYVYPKDLTKDDILKYRPRHVLYVSSIARFGMMTAEVDFRYLSRVERIDEEFVTLGIVKDGGERVAIYTTDVRFSADFSRYGVPLAATFNINNLFQYNYVELIGNLAPPRTMILTLETKL